VSKNPIRRRLKLAGVLRSPSEAAKLRVKQLRSPIYWRGENNPSWKGGQIFKNGYKMIKMPEHPRANKSGYVYEHLLVWENAHGKSLPQGYVIHHIDGNRNNNVPENLIAYPRLKHTRLIPYLLKRIKMLEEENKNLQKALSEKQLIFYMERNELGELTRNY